MSFIYFAGADTERYMDVCLSSDGTWYAYESNYKHLLASVKEPIVEKPDLPVALRYIQQKNYFWNAGIFIWNVNTIINAFRIYQPTMSKLFENLNSVYGTPDEQEAINKWFPECESISVDYAIMEKAEEIFVCPADFGWSDLGTWGSLRMQTKQDLYGNSVIGENVSLFESHNCIVHTTGERKVVVQGLDGYIVAEKDNTLLICKLSEEQRIKQFSGEE